MRLPVQTPEPVLALGGRLQVEPYLALGREAYPAGGIGDLDSEAARARLVEEAQALETACAHSASVVAIELHPDSPGTWLGERLAAARGARLVRVQHHLAHAAAVLGEHDRFPAVGARAAAIVFDGSGYGPDGVAWGCEWLLIGGDLRWSRLAHGSELPLVGGEHAVREPWRVACAALARAVDPDLALRTPMAAVVGRRRCAEVVRLAQRPGWPRATGAGRVFEAAGALFGLCTHNRREGEAAVAFEALASEHHGGIAPWREVGLPSQMDELPSARLLECAAQRLLDGEDPARTAAGFHATFACLAAELADRVVPLGVVIVALGGGCMVNRPLTSALTHALARRGFIGLLPCRLPPGDAALAYGQAVLTSAALERGLEPRLVPGGAA